MFALKDFESIHMIGKVMLKSKEFDCSSLLVLISAAGQTQNLKRLADIAELIHYQPDANKLFATLIDAYILCDNDALVAKTLIDYQSHRRTTHKGISTGEMALAFIDNDKTMLSKFREWAPAELPRIVLANVASFYATRRDIQQIGTFFKKYVLRPDILMLHWARRIAKKNLEMSKLVDKCQAEPVNGRPEQINQSLLWAKKQIEAPVSFEVGIDGPFKVVYRAMTDSWVKGLDSVTGTDGFSEEAISMTRFIEEMHSFETELVQSSVISQHLQFSGAGKS